MLRRTLTLLALATAFPATASATERAWMRTGPVNAERAYPVMVALPDGRALVAGGATAGAETFDPSAAGGTTAAAEIFDPAANRWTPVAPMAHPRRRAVGVALRDGRVLVAGGDDDARTAEVYDPRWN